jgi:hypothetical protein
MGQAFLTSDGMNRGTSVHIDECFDRYPAPIDVVKCLGKQWLKHPVKTTSAITVGVILVSFSMLYLPIKVLAVRSSNQFIRHYLA